MKVPRDGLPPLRCELRLILEGQGPDACKRVLESKITGARFRKHTSTCADCADLVRELYEDGIIPVIDEPVAPEILESLRGIGE